MKKILSIIVAVLAAVTLFAKEPLTVASVISDHMVVQRQSETPVWGWGEPGAKVKVKPSWGKASYSAVVDKDGAWRVSVSTPAAGGPYAIDIASGKEKIAVSDVLVGEVWVFSGQSNMDMPLSGYGVQFVEGMTEEIIASPRYADKVRMFRSKRPAAEEPQKDIPESSWQVASGENAAHLSAIAWFFATRLTDAIGVPVGVMDASWGGSKIEPYMTVDAVKRAIEGKISESRYKEIMSRENVPPHKVPRKISTIWNSRMYPFAGYTARGFVWYQGEANRKDRFYDKLQAEMVKMWREAWGDTENAMPFMFATIAPYSYDKDSRATMRAFFVENQLKSLKLIPNSYAAITESIGDENCIHPAKKRQVAQQFVLYALEKVYGMKMGIPAGYPYPSGYKFEGNEVIVSFDNVANGLGRVGRRTVKGFELAGEDKVFYRADAMIEKGNRDVRVTSVDVPAPVAVRYNFHNYDEGDLENSFGIPVPCFRSDNWKEK